MMNNQIILGAGGSLGNLLAKELKQYANNIFLYSRNPIKVNDEDITIKGDLLNAKQTEDALQNMSIAYLVVGLAYSTKTWKKEWSIIIKNVIKGCVKHKVALVFLDNVYMYDASFFDNLTEDTPSKVESKKGAVRMEIEKLLKAEMLENNIRIQILRAADYYGKEVKNSMFNEVFIKNVLEGKKVNWFVSGHKKHALTLVSDAAKAIALLGNTNQAYNQVWHLPTDEAFTAMELLSKLESITGKKIEINIVSKFAAFFLSFFIPAIKESRELLYQFDRDYVFNSDKFVDTFKVAPTKIDEGLREMVEFENN